jgi:DNA-binding response OmpR family regulator
MLILIVDRDAWLRRLLSVLLNAEGYSIIEAADGFRGLALLSSQPELVITELNLPGIDGETLLSRGRERGYTGKAILLSTLLAGAEAARRCGAVFVRKPFDARLLIETIRELTPPPTSGVYRPLYGSIKPGRNG